LDYRHPGFLSSFQKIFHDNGRVKYRKEVVVIIFLHPYLVPIAVACRPCLPYLHNGGAGWQLLQVAYLLLQTQPWADSLYSYSTSGHLLPIAFHQFFLPSTRSTLIDYRFQTFQDLKQACRHKPDRGLQKFCAQENDPHYHHAAHQKTKHRLYSYLQLLYQPK